MPALTKRPHTSGKRLTEGEKLLIHSERIKSNKTTRQLAREYGVSNSTVSDIEHNERLRAKIEQSDHIKKALSAESYIIAAAAGSRVLEDMHRASAYQAAGIRHYAIEDARLVEGSSTLNISIKTVVSDLEERKRQLLDAINVTPEG
mgnify:FL=1